MNDIELKILIGMHKNVNALDKMTSKLASESGLTFSQFAVLEALYSKGDMSVGMLQKHILSSMGTIPLIINNLVKTGCVLRSASQKDRRVCMVSLTDKGRTLIQNLAPKNEEIIKDSLRVLTKEEQEELLYLMKKLGGKLNEEKSAK